MSRFVTGLFANYRGLPRRFASGRTIRLGAACLAMLALTATAREPWVVTQKGRAFRPGMLVIQQGDTLEFVNDDGELIHHAYVASDNFSFDSGDQEPGSKTDVVFSVRGHFTVLCGIHPKMHLSVEVQ